MPIKTTTMDIVIQKALILLGGITVFIVPLKEYFVALFVIMLVDIMTRIMVVVKEEGYKGVKSSKMFHTIPKFIIYCLGLIAGKALQDIEPTIPIVKAVAYFIAVVEFKSVSENIADYTGLNIFEAVKDYMNRRGRKTVKEEDVQP